MNASTAPVWSERSRIELELCPVAGSVRLKLPLITWKRNSRLPAAEPLNVASMRAAVRPPAHATVVLVAAGVVPVAPAATGQVLGVRVKP